MDLKTLEQLGITKEKLEEKLIDSLTYELLTSEIVGSQSFKESLKEFVKKKIDSNFEMLAKKELEPGILEYLKNFKIKSTNKYGEKIGEELSLVEYLVKYADNFLIEMVDNFGKSKKESDYNWSAKQSRINYLIDQYLKRSIDEQLTKAISTIDQKIKDELKKSISSTIESFSRRFEVKVL